MVDNPQNAAPQAGQPAAQEGEQITLRMDESKMVNVYANAFRTNATPEEVVVDFGTNMPNPGARNQMVMQIGARVILNYYSAKRLALALGQIVQRHEDQFGSLELDVTKRRKS